MTTKSQATFPKHREDVEYTQKIFSLCKALVGKPIYSIVTEKSGIIMSAQWLDGVVTLTSVYRE